MSGKAAKRSAMGIQDIESISPISVCSCSTIALSMYTYWFEMKYPVVANMFENSLIDLLYFVKM